MKVYILVGLTSDSPPDRMIISVHPTQESAEKEKAEQEKANEDAGEYIYFRINEHEVRP